MKLIIGIFLLIIFGALGEMFIVNNFFCGIYIKVIAALVGICTWEFVKSIQAGR